MKKYIKIENLCCAHCAQKIEAQANKVEGVIKATHSFMAEKMLVEYKDDADFDCIYNAIVEICKKVEPECEVSL